MLNDYDRFIHCFMQPTPMHGYILEAGWYFTDESYDYHGPFSTREETIELFNKYVKELNNDRPRASDKDGSPGTGGIR